MKKHIVKIESIDKITHDVLKIVCEKPPNYSFTPGQATEISINKDGWLNKKRPFTFTGLPSNDYLEFTIKTYPVRKSVTNELLQLKKDDELILNDIFGAISYKGEGVFIAGGAGVTPFISIFRHLHAKNEIGSNKLIFANKKKNDIILAGEFEKLLGKNFINILSDEDVSGYRHGLITEDFLKAEITGKNKLIYLCGPPPMMDEVNKQLANLGINKSDIIEEAI